MRDDDDGPDHGQAGRGIVIGLVLAAICWWLLIWLAMACDALQNEVSAV